MPGLTNQSAGRGAPSLENETNFAAASRKSSHLTTLYNALKCPADSTLSKSAKEYFSKPSSGNQLKSDLGEIYRLSEALKSASAPLNAALLDGIRAHVDIYWTGESLGRWDASRDAIVSVLDRLHSRIGDKDIRTMAELLDLAQTPEEKQLLDLVFSSASGGALDYLIGQDRANFYRNRLLYGAIPKKEDGYRLKLSDPNSLLELSPDQKSTLGPLSAALEKILEGVPGKTTSQSIETAWRTIAGLAPGQRELARQYLQRILKRIESGVMDQGNDQKTLIPAERLRSAAHTLLYGLARETLLAKAKDRPKDGDRVSSNLCRLIVPDGSNSDLLSHYASQKTICDDSEPKAKDREKLMEPFRLKLEDAKGEDAKHTIYREAANSAGKITRQELDDFAAAVKHRQAELWASSYRLNDGSPYLYGRTLKKERSTERALAPEVKTITARVAEQSHSLTPTQRTELAKKFDAGALSTFSPLFAPNTRKLTDSSLSPADREHKALQPTPEALAKIAADADGKADEVFSLAALTGLGGHSFSEAFARLSKILPADTLPGVSFKDIPKLSGEQKQSVLDQIEKKLREDRKNLTESQIDGLLLASQWIREWDYNPSEAHDLADPAELRGDLSRPAQLRLQDRITDLHQTARQIGKDGTTALHTVEEVKKHLAKQGLRIPLRAEGGLLLYLLQNSADATDSIRTLMKEMKPADFKSFIAGLAETRTVEGKAESSADQIHQALKKYSPEMHYLLSDARFNIERLRNQAVQDILNSGALSERTKSMLPALFGTYLDCTPLTVVADSASEQERLTNATALRECVTDGIWRDAAVSKMRTEGAAASQDLLKKRFKSETDQTLAWDKVRSEVDRLAELSGGVGHSKSLTQAQIDQIWDNLTAPSEPEPRSIAELKMRDLEQASLGREQLETERIEREQRIDRNELARIQTDVQNLEKTVKNLEEKKAASTKENPSYLAKYAPSFVAPYVEMLPSWNQSDSVWTPEAEKELVKVKADLAAANGIQRLHFNEARKKGLELIDLGRENQRYDSLIGYVEGQIEKLKKAAADASGDTADQNFIDEMNARAAKLEESAVQLREAKNEFKASRKLLPKASWSLTLLNLLPKTDDDEVDPVAAKLSRIRRRLQDQGALVDDAGKELSEEALFQLLSQVSPATFAPTKMTGNALSKEIEKIVAECTAKKEACPYTGAELEHLKSLAERNTKREIELDRISHMNGFEEEASERQSARLQGKTIQDSLLKEARSELDRADEDKNRQYKSALAYQVANSLKRKGLGSDDVDEEARFAYGQLRLDQTVSDWGHAIARALPRRAGDFPHASDPAFYEKAQKWVAKEGLESAVNEWVSSVASGRYSIQLSAQDARRYFYDGLLREESQKFAKADATRKTIENKLSAIVTPSGSRSPQDFLWNWEDARLHLIAPEGKAATGKYKMTRAEFDKLLDQYSDTLHFSPDGHGSEYTSARTGREELRDFLNFQHNLPDAEGQDTFAVNSKSAMAVQTVGGKRVETFIDLESKKKDYEATAKELGRILSNNGDMKRLIDHEGGVLEGAARTGKAITGLYNPLNATTNNDLELAQMIEKATADIVQLQKLGSTKLKVQIDFNEEPQDTPAEDIAKVMSLRLGQLLAERKESLKGVETGYDLAQEGLVAVGTSVAVGGPLSAVLRSKRAYDALRAIRLGNRAFRKIRLAQHRAELAFAGTKFGEKALKIGGSVFSHARQAEVAFAKTDLGKKALKIGGSIYSMGRMGALTPFYGMPIGAATGAIAFAKSGKHADDLSLTSTSDPKWNADLNKNGIADWRDAIEQGVPYTFPKEIEAEVDHNANGIPDMYETSYGGRFAHENIIGSVAELYNQSKWGGIRLSMAPIGGMLMKPLLRPIAIGLEKTTPLSRGYWMGFSQMAGMGALNGAMDSYGINAGGVAKPVGDSILDAGIQSLVAGPFDDWWSYKYMAGKARKLGPAFGAKEIAGAELRRRIINHGSDGLAGMIEVWRRGHYETGTGEKISNPFLAAAASIGEGWVIGGRVSKAGNETDLVPAMFNHQVRAGKIKAGDPILEMKLPNGRIDENGNHALTSVKELIGEDARYKDYLEAKNFDGLVALLDTRLKQEKISPQYAKKAMEAVRAKVNWTKRAFGDLDSLHLDIVHEREADVLIAGTRKGTVDAANILEERDPETKYLVRRYHNFSADKIPKGDPTVMKQILDRTAREFGIEPAVFEQKVTEAAQAGSKRSLKQIANELQKAKYRENIRYGAAAY